MPKTKVSKLNISGKGVTNLNEYKRMLALEFPLVNENTWHAHNIKLFFYISQFFYINIYILVAFLDIPLPYKIKPQW